MMMKKKLKTIGHALCLTAGIAAVGLFYACSEEVQNLLTGNGTEVQVNVSFADADETMTRAADGLNSTSGFSLLTSTNSSSKVRVMVDQNDGSYTPFDYNITAATTLGIATAPTFNSGVSSVNVYGWYPNVSLTDFSVAADQTGNGGYCLSDLMAALGTTCTRNIETGAITSAANLSFTHLMAKVKVSLTLASGVTVKSVKFKNMLPQVDVTPTKTGNAVTAYDVSAAEGSATDITLLTDGSLTSSSAAADKLLCGVFPEQPKNGAFLEITASYNAGADQTITYSFSSAKTFVKGNVYVMNISLDGTNVTTGTVDITDWNTAAGTVNIGSGGGGSLSLDNTSSALTYGGSNGTINVTEASVSTCSASSADASIATVSTSGTVVTITPVAAGSTQVLVYATKDGNMLSSVVDVTVGKATPTITLSTAALSIGGVGNTGTFTVTRSGNGDIVATSSDNAIATTSVNQSTGVVTVTNVAVGSATITVTTNEGTNYLAYTASDKTVAVTTIADPGVALSSATKGMIVASNGKAYTTGNYSSSYGDKVAVVAKSGYAIALVDASSDTWNSITNSGANKNVDCVLAEGKRGSVPAAPTGTTWKVLNMANYKAVFQAMGSADTYNATSNALITDAGGTALSGTYWSTQENGVDYGYYFASGGWNGNDKTNSFNVRPVLVW